MDYLEKIVIENTKYLFKSRLLVLLLMIGLFITDVIAYCGISIKDIYLYLVFGGTFITCAFDIIEFTYAARRYYNTKEEIIAGGR